MTTYIEPNRADPGECDACLALEDLCDFHLGFAQGVGFMSDLMSFAAGDPEAIEGLRSAQATAPR